MPQDPLQSADTTNPQTLVAPTARKSARALSILGIIGIVCVFLAVSLYVSWPKLRTILVPQELSDSTQKGEYAKAVQITQAILDDPNTTDEQKALAVLSYVGARYRVSGDASDLLLDIRDLKKVILNPAVSAKTRADSMAWLAGMYGSFGRNRALFVETYKDEPFKSYLVEGDPELSARHLFEFSYKINPSSYAAINIASWYASQGVLHPDLDQASRDTYIKLATDNLALAESISLQEQQANPNYINGARYQVFRARRAAVVGELATQKVEPYSANYRGEFEGYIQFAESGEHVLAKGLLLGVRSAYASALESQGAIEEVKIQLDAVAEGMKNRQNPAVSNYILMLRNEHQYEWDTGRGRIITQLYQYSPNFQAAIESAIAEN